MHLNHITKPANMPVRKPLRKQIIKPDPNWRPEPCPLTRDELRQIVAEQLG
jgi:hypothetical protein